MVTLYWILILQIEHDANDVKELKRLMYSLLYMDNGGISASSPEKLKSNFEQINQIFSPYHFSIQQVMTNDMNLQKVVDGEEEPTPDTVKLLGLSWDRVNDSLSTRPVILDVEANTKRSILSTVASQFDVHNFNLPLLNRSRLFLHSLQCNKGLKWDDKLDSSLQKEWQNICRQVNSAPEIKIDRCFGPRDGKYNLLAFADASHALFGIVVYLQEIGTGKLHFVCAKNRIINSQLKLKSIPSLELNSVTLAVEALTDLYKELSGSSCVTPIDIERLAVFTDSTCSLHWLNASAIKLEKMKKHSTFVLNRINLIQKYCETHPISFNFIPGKFNPADCTTRCLSHKQLMKSNFLSGPDIGLLESPPDIHAGDVVQVTIPNPLMNHCSECISLISQNQPLIDIDTYSDYNKLVRIHGKVLKCLNIWKEKVGVGSVTSHENLFIKANHNIIRAEQYKHFPSEIDYLNNPSNFTLSEIPPLVSKLNIIKDDEGLLRVKGKFSRWTASKSLDFPILLPKSSQLTVLIVRQLHENLNHAGRFTLLSELRKQFYILHHFSVVKQIVKNCIHCRRFHGRNIKLSQGEYRDFRSSPPQIPFATVFLDHLGPFNIKKEGDTYKVWLLLFSCTWSRAVNLEICYNLTMTEFLRCFQIHCFKFGLPQKVLSDHGSQLVAGSNVISDFINDHNVSRYFEENNVSPLSFQHYYKGKHELGSLVESMVKLVKKLLFGAIQNNIVDIAHFQFLIANTIHILNRRPIAFKETLQSDVKEMVPEPITPELLLYGRELLSLNLIPGLFGPPNHDANWVPGNTSYDEEMEKVKKIKSKLQDAYEKELTGTLIHQAVNKDKRYIPISHRAIEVGDIVLIKNEFSKPNNYPLAVVKDIQVNSLGEVTGATLIKGRNREIIKRHSNAIIPLLANATTPNTEPLIHNPEVNQLSRPMRKSAIKGRQKVSKWINEDLV